VEGYETVQEAAERLGVSRSRVQLLCKQGRLSGAHKVGEGRRGVWLILKDSWPTRARFGRAGSWEETRPQGEWAQSSPQEREAGF
jgi:excisionase family DNA binding protein